MPRSQTGAITDRRIIAVASWLERFSYRRAAAVTVLSDDLRDNVAAKMPARRRGRVHVIPNFVDTELIEPGHRLTAYRTEHDIGDEMVVMYAGNVGFSQSLELLLAAARELPQVTFVINGDGSARASLQAAGGRTGQRSLRRLPAEGAAARGARHGRPPRGATARRTRAT